MNVLNIFQITLLILISSVYSYAIDIDYNTWQNDRMRWVQNSINLLIKAQSQNKFELFQSAKNSHPFTNEEIKIYIQQAHHNKANSQIILGLFYLFGIQHKQDIKKAVKWIKKASKSLYPQSYLILNLLKKYQNLNNKQEFENYKRYLDLTDNENEVHVFAYLQLGIMKLLGEGTSKNEKLALQYLKLADKKGSSQASYYLAMLYLDGSENITINKKLALKWLKKAALNHHPSACYYLARFYEEGILLSRDMVSAIRFYYFASNQNHAKATYRLSLLLSEGKIIPYNFKKSFNYLQKAAKLGELNAIFDLAKLYLYKNSKIIKNQHLAKKWLEKAAQKNHLESQKLLASLYLEIKLYTKAFKWFQKLALTGDSRSSYMVAKMLLDGIGVNKDYKSFLYFLKQAALSNHPKASNLYANILYQKALDTDKISLFQDSFYWMMKAAKLGEAESQYQLAIFYSKGLGTVTNKQQAFYWYQKAAKQSHINSHIVLASMLMNGEGHEIDTNRAVYHYKQAAILNDKDAQMLLYKLFSQGDSIDQNLVEAYAWLNVLNAHTHEFFDELQDIQNEISSNDLNQAQNLSLSYLHKIQKN
ncbi:MAG: hypothetical protein COB02_16270 [Candidatus Cloacimonadota bacterium]|nr:MAG: hypothetical protein COB02_16270 [Candidatus Cloacimonadota bacterium]